MSKRIVSVEFLKVSSLIFAALIEFRYPAAQPSIQFVQIKKQNLIHHQKK